MNKAPVKQPQSPKPVGDFFEQLKSIGRGTADSFFNDLVGPMPGEVVKQVGIRAEAAQNPEEQVLFDGEAERKKRDRQLKSKLVAVQISQLQQRLRAEAVEYQSKVSELIQTIENVAKTADIEVPVAVNLLPARPGKYHLHFFARILADLRIKADQATEWHKTQSIRISTKRPRGVLVWLGDQKYVTEQGSLFQLQG